MALSVFYNAFLLMSLLPAAHAQIQHFFSKPTLAPPTLIVKTNNASYTDAGYIFMTPFQDAQPSALIFDADGTLIWDGEPLAVGLNAHDLTVCTIQDVDQLCFITAVQENGYARGDALVVNSSYQVTHIIHSGNNLPGIDQHEFKVLNNGASALLTIYNQVEYNPAPFGIQNVSWTQEGVFQEVNLTNNDVIFQWNSLDHVPVNESYVLPGTTDISGDGLSNNTAWDYFHINSVDKTTEGHYLISARHTKTVYLINGTDSSVIWQLGGKSSNFTQDYEFNFQHHARVRAEFPDRMTISIFDNGADDSAPAPGKTKAGYEAMSNGMVLEIMNETMQSTVTARYYSPGLQLASSQGDLQFLSNGNRFMGLGDLPFAVEFTPNSTGDSNVVYYAHLNWGTKKTYSSYRNFKYTWSGQPAAAPDVFAYAQNCTGALAAYASWNGATELTGWQFYAGTTGSGPFTALPSITNKTGFETIEFGSKYAPYVYAEALDFKRNILSKSLPVRTFVPAPTIEDCGPLNCGTTLNYSTAGQIGC